MSESTEPKEQAVARLAEEEHGASEDYFSTWDDCAIFRVEAMDEPRHLLLAGIRLDAAECIERCFNVLWPIREQMGDLWRVTKVLFDSWLRTSTEYQEACDRQADDDEVDKLAAHLLDSTNEIYYHTRIWSDVFDLEFTDLLERELLELSVSELLSRRYFDKAGLKAQRDELARANQGLLKAIKSKAHKKAKSGQAHVSSPKCKEAAAQ